MIWVVLLIAASLKLQQLPLLRAVAARPGGRPIGCRFWVCLDYGVNITRGRVKLRSANWMPFIGEHGMKPVRDACDQGLQEVHGCRPICLLMQLDEGELGGAIDRNEEVD